VLGSLPFLWIGITTAWWVPLALITGFLPSLIIKWNLEERLWALEIQNGERGIEGGYFFNGKNSKEIAVNDLRRSFAAVYQDFARFPMTFEENAAISEIAEQFNDEPDSFKTEKKNLR